jgi:ABC-type dipeptide/oligopeptide/nickel transport system permease component
VIRQVCALVGTLWLAATLAFFALRVLPGDALQAELLSSGASAQTIAERRAALGLDDPLVAQYWRFLAGALRGDLGVSLLDGRPVSEIVGQQVAPTLVLAASALVVAAVGGMALGTLAALGWKAAQLILNLSLTTPLYWTGTLAIYVFAVRLDWLPTSGANNIILPAAVLGFHSAGAVGQVVRASVRDALGQDFVRTARAKGLRESGVIMRHVLRAALLPVVSVIALQAGFLLGGVVITESLFVRPGIGRVLLDATLRQDYPVVQGVVVLGALVYTLVNAAADALSRLLDPRL